MTPVRSDSRRTSLVAAGIIMLILGVVAQVPATAAQDPNAFVATLGSEGIQAVGSGVSSAERLARLRNLFRTDFDVTGIGLFALGRYRSIATPQEQQQFFALYPDFTVQALNARLNEYGRAQFRVTGNRMVDGKTVVNSEIIRSDGRQVQLDWSLIDSGGQYRITDVDVGGVSMKIGLRDQFTSWIQNNGGQFHALLAVLRQELTQAP